MGEVELRLLTSPGDSYASALRDTLATASRFDLVAGFVSAAGVERLAPAIRACLEAGGQGRIVVAVDRQGFNTAAAFEALLALKEGHRQSLSIGLVLQQAGLLHAKALYATTSVGDRLVIGSANLTQTALAANHELGVSIVNGSRELRRAFLDFMTSLAPRSLDGPDARAFLAARGLVAERAAVPRCPPSPATIGAVATIAEILGKLPPLPPLPTAPDAHLARWISRGYIVGRGRRSLDAIVLRLPQEQLVNRGYLRTPRRELLGLSSHETRTTGYGIDLLPSADADALRRDARRVSLLLSKLSLNLPCFGLWMPESYWNVFLAAREHLRGASAIAPDRIHDLAVAHRAYLSGGGLDAEIANITERLQQLDLLVPGKGDDLRALLLERFRGELTMRTPEVVASCVEFRTARQRWAPYEQTEAPHRQLIVDLVQATFAATYRTGDWPRRFRSFVARGIADAIAERVGAAADLTAVALLDRATSWEDPTRAFVEVVDEFRQLFGDEIEFRPPELSALTGVEEEDDDELR